MKFYYFVFLLLPLSVFAAAPTNSLDCLKQVDKIDRKYCFDKYLDGVQKKIDLENKTWAKGIHQKDQKEKAETLEKSINLKKEYLELMTNEMGIYQKQLESLNKAKILKEEVKKKEKKDDDDKGSKKPWEKGFKVKL